MSATRWSRAPGTRRGCCWIATKRLMRRRNDCRTSRDFDAVGRVLFCGPAPRRVYKARPALRSSRGNLALARLQRRLRQVLVFEQSEERGRGVRPFAGLTEDQSHLTTEADLGHGQRDEIAARDFRFGAAPWQQR